MAYRECYALDTLESEVNRKWPGRPKGADGWIGDADHASRSSDHNPWVIYRGVGIVTAHDFSEWVQNGIEMNDVLCEMLRASRDPRIKYVISDGRIFSSYPTRTRRAWEWGPYSGVNKHTKHIHVSVHPDPHLFDSRAPWGILAKPTPVPPPRPSEDDMSKIGPGSHPNVVKMLQEEVVEWYTKNNKSCPITAEVGARGIDGIYGSDTKAAVAGLQAGRLLDVREPGIADAGTLGYLALALHR